MVNLLVVATLPRCPAVDQLDCGSGADKAHKEAEGDDDGIVPDWHILSDPLGECVVYWRRHDVNMDFVVKCWGRRGEGCREWTLTRHGRVGEIDRT